MGCAYARGLASTGTNETDHTGLSTRAAAREVGCGATSVRMHRRGECVCAETHKIHTDTQDTPLPPKDHMELGPDGGTLTFNTYNPEPIKDWSDVLRYLGADPELWEVASNSVRVSRWGQSARSKDGDRDVIFLTAYKADIRPKATTIDLPALYAAQRHATPVPSPAPNNRATVVVYADPQVGKVGRRGGTEELLARSAVARHKLNDELTKRAPSRVLLADAGDGIEGFESGGNPMFTNDLSLAGQLDTYGTELFEFINICHAHAPVTVMGVPSNHAAWRNGKQNLGRPADDLGLFVHRQVGKITTAAGMDVDWVSPEDYDESVAVTVLDTKIGLVHGNQFAPGKGVDWWQKQTFGAGAASGSDILVHGHYHNFSSATAGRNPLTGRPRWLLGAPTLDNGSDWFRQTAGWDSDPGLLIFDITDQGFDLSSLTILGVSA